MWLENIQKMYINLGHQAGCLITEIYNEKLFDI